MPACIIPDRDGSCSHLLPLQQTQMYRGSRTRCSPHSRAFLSDGGSLHGLNALDQFEPTLSTSSTMANPPPFSSTMTVWQRASSLRNSLSTGSLSRWAASSSVASQKSNFSCTWWLQVTPEPCKRHREAAGTQERLSTGLCTGDAAGCNTTVLCLVRSNPGKSSSALLSIERLAIKTKLKTRRALVYNPSSPVLNWQLRTNKLASSREHTSLPYNVGPCCKQAWVITAGPAASVSNGHKDAQEHLCDKGRS